MINVFQQPQQGVRFTEPNLKSFNLNAQAYGNFFAGFPWQIYGCLTFRNHTTLYGAHGQLNTLMSRMGKKLKARVAYLAVPERRTSGCGLPAIPLHWHFVAAAPSQHQERLPRLAKEIWEYQRVGFAHVEPYIPELSRAHYLAKTVNNPDFDYVFSNLDRLCYTGKKDLYGLQQVQQYVPEHVRPLSHAQTLAIRGA
jgi:hypothetical protein